MIYTSHAASAAFAGGFDQKGYPMRSAVAMVAPELSVSGPSDPYAGDAYHLHLGERADLVAHGLMVSAFGPTKINPLFSTCSAKAGFSDKKPYPG